MPLEAYFKLLKKSFQYVTPKTRRFRLFLTNSLSSKSIYMFNLRYDDQAKFYYWYQNDKLKFRKSGTNDIYDLHLKN